MKIKFTSDAPGSSGEVEMEVTQEQYEFLMKFCLEFNNVNELHSQPYFDVKEI